MGAQSLAWGKDIPGSGDKFLRVKQKGDRVQFKIAQLPVFTGKHFMQTDENTWKVDECPRIASNDECDHCSVYFETLAEVKKLKASDETLTDKSPSVKPLLSKMRENRVAIQFYFAVLDRTDPIEDGRFRILQTTNGVRKKLDALINTGVDPSKTEFILSNTGSANPNEIYMLTTVDSALVKKMSKVDETELEKAKKYDLSSVSQSGSDRETTLDDFS